ncbi:MAG: sigma-70 family RNA polymerase sigma factor [candidate division KSB1 bacterium]
MLGRKEEAEDAMQTTFLKLYRSRAQFQFGARFSTYLFRIMMNVCCDRLRQRKGEHTQELPEQELSYVPGIELRVQLEEAIGHLPERMRACFVMFALEEMKQEDIAAALDLSVGTVKAQIFHAKQKLRALLAETPIRFPL